MLKRKLILNSLLQKESRELTEEQQMIEKELAAIAAANTAEPEKKKTDLVIPGLTKSQQEVLQQEMEAIGNIICSRNHADTLTILLFIALTI